MPMKREKYPPDWEQIAAEVKEAAGWKCEACGKQCRLPGEPFDTHKRTLTVAHINHVESDCRPENLLAACPACHLAYDRERRRWQRLAKRRVARLQRETLFLDRS